MTTFEGSFLGDRKRIDDAARMECGVCWWVYDPDLGDEVWHVAPGTPFSQLPAHWRCPHCDAAPHQFMVLHDHGRDGVDVQRPTRPAGLDRLDTLSIQLREAYERAAVAMQSLPVYNPRLDIAITGARRCQAGIVAVVSTPWCMNLVLLADDDQRRREGSAREVAFPSGRYSFVSGYLDGVGAIETCSLFSPMQEFEDAAAASAVAEEAIKALFQPDEPAETAGMSRRAFLRPGLAG